MSKINSKTLTLFVLLFILIFGYFQVKTNFDLFSKLRSSLSTSLSGVSSETIYDFRESNPTSLFQKVPPTESQELFKKLFKKYLETEENCPNKIPTASNFFETGIFVPNLKGKLEGSFTQKNKTEILYAITIDDCAQAKATWYPEMIVIYSGEQKVFETLILPSEPEDPIGYFGEPLKLLDLNNDQINEILVMGSGSGQGINVESAQILQIQNSHLSKISDFKQVFEDSCDAGYPDSAILASLITYQGEKEGKPNFQIENYTKSCIANSQFRVTDKNIGE